MRRELLIVALVLVPCAVLFWLGFTLTSPATESPRADSALDGGLVTPSTEPEAPVRSPALARDAGSPAMIPKELEAPLRAVSAEVQRCFDDQRAHLHEPQRLEVRFTPTADGGFAGVIVSATANPYLSACVEDVFDEVRWQPTGVETFQPATHAFTFEPR